MANRKEKRFIQKELMKKDRQLELKKICSPRYYDGINECYRSFFAMHWRNYPNLDIVPMIKKRQVKHTKRNLGVKRKEMIA